MPVYPGDPLTPAVGATDKAKRLDLKQAQTITKIPVLPISYGDAQPLELARFRGQRQETGLVALAAHADLRFI
jgi:N-acetylated-alpha-linked acidic dipeptidase